MEKFLENLRESEKIIKTADHIIYVTLPLVKDKRLLLKMLQEIKEAVVKSINALLQYEYLFKRIRLSKNARTNFKTFEEKCAPKYEIKEKELELILELLNLTERHKKSPMEFVRDNKIVIMSQNLETRIVTIEKVKEFLQLAKDLLKKIKEGIQNQR